jgi:hypothetical protein
MCRNEVIEAKSFIQDNNFETLKKYEINQTPLPAYETFSQMDEEIKELKSKVKELEDENKNLKTLLRKDS